MVCETIMLVNREYLCFGLNYRIGYILKIDIPNRTEAGLRQCAKRRAAYLPA